MTKKSRSGKRISGVVAIAAGNWHDLALKAEGTVWAWGLNSAGQLGNGANSNSYIPIQLNELSGVTAIAASGSHSLALKADSTVWAWGDNTNGQLGTGTVTDRLSRIQVAFLNGVAAVAAGSTHSMAVKEDGTVWAWGYNYYGQIGDNTTSNKLTPVQVNGLTGVTAIAARNFHSLALKADPAPLSPVLGVAPVTVAPTPGGVLGSKPLLGTLKIDNDRGTIIYALARVGETSPIGVKGVLANLEFRAKSGATGTAKIDLTKVGLTNENFEEIMGVKYEGAAVVFP
ncbi:MAG: hypothetical protein Q7R50_03960 [Dehalococcoidales bacterium]|nr:hypothetical protein [Dehalococcoidales bacterium]